MKTVVIMNGRSGQLAAEEVDSFRLVQQAMESIDLDAEIRTVSGEELSAATSAAVDCGAELIVAAGGDGTLSTVAGALCGTRVPLGILPTGTLNHFARDLGIPLEIHAAAAVLREQHCVTVDVGRVNGRTFINNASLGHYVWAVRHRERGRGLFGWRKWPAMARAAVLTFRRLPMLELSIGVNGETLVRKTPQVVIGNNAYELDLFSAGRRTCLTDGELSLYVADTQTRWGIIKLVLRGIFNRLNESRDFHCYTTKSLVIDSKRSRMHMALDGEVVEVEPPLKFEVQPAALRVMASKPRETEGSPETSPPPRQAG